MIQNRIKHRRSCIHFKIKRKEVKTVTIIERLKNLDADKVDLDELITLSALAKVLRAEYEYYGAEAPAWLDQRLRALGRAIRLRQEDYVEKRLAEAKARLAALKPESEKREDLQKEIQALESRLAH
jgi:hypothetical protein